MNKRKALLEENRLLQEVIHMSRYGNKEGCIKINPHNSLVHEQTKLAVAHKLMNLGYSIWSEVQFRNKKQGDILAIQNGVGFIIEILHSESDERYNAKLSSYPNVFTMVKVRTKDFDYDTFCL